MSLSPSSAIRQFRRGGLLWSQRSFSWVVCSSSVSGCSANIWAAPTSNSTASRSLSFGALPRRRATMDSRPEFDQYAARYEALLEGALLPTGVDSDRFAAYKIDEIAHILRDRSTRRILDFGCGTGRSLHHFQRAFPAAAMFGYDPSSECAAAARARCPGVVVTSNWDALPRDSFDCIVATNVFHHVPRDERPAMMARCALALAPHGSFFVFEHNPLNPL